MTTSPLSIRFLIRKNLMSTCYVLSLVERPFVAISLLLEMSSSNKSSFPLTSTFLVLEHLRTNELLGLNGIKLCLWERFNWLEYAELQHLLGFSSDSIRAISSFIDPDLKINILSLRSKGFILNLIRLRLG
jgi:hypothetical protein